MSFKEPEEILDNILAKQVQKMFEDGIISEDEISKTIIELFKDTKEELSERTICDLKLSAPKMLDEMKQMEKGFNERCFIRWKDAFNHLDMMWVIAEEIGRQHIKELEVSEHEVSDAVLTALANLNAKALLITQEIICLLKGGFPDGALARWRSLHEIVVTAMYIAKHGDDVAKRYLLSFHFTARRAAKQINEYSARANLEKFTEAEMKDFDERCNFAAKQLGERITKDSNGEWPKINVRHKNFASIESDVEMDHWRPRYKWASKHTHADHRPSDKLLGNVEADDGHFLIGASNSGFVDPLQMTGISLAQMLSTFLLYTPNFDRIIYSDIILKLSEELGPLASKIESETMLAHKENLER